jgi:hypothetical protein
MARVIAIWSWFIAHPLILTMLVTSGANLCTYWLAKVAKPEFQQKHIVWHSIFKAFGAMGINPVPAVNALRDAFLAARGLHPLQLELAKSGAVTMVPTGDESAPPTTRDGQ